jgi:hypothetical protein
VALLLISVSVRQAQTVHKSDVKIPTIHITGEGALYLNDKPVNINLLANQIKRNFPKASEVSVRPDKDMPWEVVSQVFAALNAAKPPIPVRPVRFVDRPGKFKVACYPEKRPGTLWLSSPAFAPLPPDCCDAAGCVSGA